MSPEKRPPPTTSPLLTLRASSQPTTLGVRFAREASTRAWRLDPAFLPSALRGLAWGVGSVPRAPALVIDRSLMASALASPWLFEALWKNMKFEFN